MRHAIRVGLLTLLALAVWSGLFLLGSLEGWWRRPLAPRDDPAAFAAAAKQMIAEAAPGALAFQLIENGRPADAQFVSKGAAIDGDTLFQVASLSKWTTALGVMTLVESGKIKLDAPVDTYLKRWKLPASTFDNRLVTVRRLLSHTAGLTDGLGYGGFEPGQPIQPLVESLTRASDASPGADGSVRVGQEPGGGWKYSGGGYALLQLLIEDTTGEPFNDYMRRAVLAPLGMSRSTYVLPDDGVENLAGFYDGDGGPATHYRFSATGAASLYTSVNDLSRLIQAHLPGPAGEPPGRGVLKPQTLQEMRRAHASRLGADIWGLGVILYAPNRAGGSIIGHDGSNAPAINTSARFDPASGDGVIVLESGDQLLATKLAGEWVFWNTGNVDSFTLIMEARQMLATLAIGWILIIATGVVVGWRLRPSRRRPGQR